MALLTETLQGISNLTISADLHGRLALEESFNWKNQFTCFQKHFLQTLITRPNNLLKSENISKFYV